jgi:catecholate siderophore receptor
MLTTVHIRAAALLILVATGKAGAQSPPSPTPTLPRDTVFRDTVARDSTARETAAKPTVDTSIAPRLKPVMVKGRSSTSSGYMRLESSSATKTPSFLRDVPQAITVINRALIRDQSMQNMADVVRYVPGITIGQGEGNRDQATIRGNATTADFFVDGVRDDSQYFRDLYNVDRVEALKGPNAMMFGRGGGGGVINRVMKEAGWIPSRELTLQGGSYDNKRATIDVGHGIDTTVALRFNGLYENSGLFRDNVRLERQGLNPTLTLASKSRETRVSFGYENFADHRTADRGVPSFTGAPLQTDLSTFFGDPALSFSDVRVNSAEATVSHETSTGLSLRNQSRFTSYDKVYQNVFPGAVSTDGQNVALSAYNNAHQRRNLFNQTDLTYTARTGALSHTLLVGAELGRQVTDNFRQTGYFNDSSTTISTSITRPTVTTPVTFRQSATDADNHVRNTTSSIYLQDQMALSELAQLIAGIRYERFGLVYHNNRSDSTLSRTDAMISPRIGLVLKPTTPVSLYVNYSLSFLPSAGDQFSSLTDVTKALAPERFRNVEIGAKWDVADRIALTAAAYRLDRSNTKAPAPNNPGLTVLTGTQRSNGYELGVTGNVTSAWDIAGGFARQNAFITSTTSAAKTGATVPLVPATTLSLWNKYQLPSGLGVGLGLVHQARMYAAVDNRVTLPAFTRFDGAMYLDLLENVRAQLNVENVLNERYHPLANGNNNITPGSPRALRISLTAGF